MVDNRSLEKVEEGKEDDLELLYMYKPQILSNILRKQRTRQSLPMCWFEHFVSAEDSLLLATAHIRLA